MKCRVSCIAPAGDEFLLVEYGEAVLDLELRFRVHALMDWLRLEKLPGIIDLTPGIRSLQIHYDSQRLGFSRLLDVLSRAESELPSVDAIDVPTRIVHMPLSWDDPETRLAIENIPRSCARMRPWTPSNIEFIRRINGLPDVQAVKDIVFGARYLVLGLGDVYPRRARRHTARSTAPLGDHQVQPRAHLDARKRGRHRRRVHVHLRMEGPGGYQFVGRTVQVYNRFKTTNHFQRARPGCCASSIRFDFIRSKPKSCSKCARPSRTGGSS